MALITPESSLSNLFKMVKIKGSIEMHMVRGVI